MTLTPVRFEAGFEILRELTLRGEPALACAFEASRGRFFAGGQPARAEGAPEQLAAERRHLEWFLFENAREGSTALVVEELLEPWSARVDRDLREASAAYLESRTGIFEVAGAPDEDTVVLRELAGLATFEVVDDGLGTVFDAGDLVVGRLHPLGAGGYHLSPGAGVFREPSLLRAVEADLERLRETRARTVMRLSQLELEAMFFGAGEAVGEHGASTSGGDAVGELESFLHEGGIPGWAIAAWCERLRRAPIDEDALIPAAEDAVAEMLEYLAFETELDLDRARALCLAAWPALRERAARPSVPAAGESSDVETLLAEFDRDRAAGVDVEASFSELERKLGLEGDDQGDNDPAPDFPGVVGAMIEEFLWETRTTHGERQGSVHEGLRLFAGYAREIGVFENLGPRDLLAFAAFWLPESRQLKSGAEAERLMRALAAFGEWARETQGVDVLEERLGERLESLRENLPRAVVANALLPRVQDVEGELFSYRGRAEDGLGRIRAVDGDEREVVMEERLASLLVPGDLFRGYTRDDGEFVVACCYPPEAADLRQTRS